MSKCKLSVGMLYGFIHFSVEVASFSFLFSRIHASPMVWALALFFDALAFLSQGLLGNLSDAFPRLPIGPIGGITMLAGLFVGADLPALCLIALGNAMIHVAGAGHTLRGSGGRITPGALFVGAGSFGVITGQLLGRMESASTAVIAVPVCLLFVSTALMLVLDRTDPIAGIPAQFDCAAKKSGRFIVIGSLIGVSVRGYIAYAIPTEWNKTVLQTVALFVCMGIGKISGGVLCDSIGCRRVTWISLLGGLPFLLAGNANMALSLIGITLFSMTMPVTAAVLASKFPHLPGFAFGITTIGLFLGTLPAFFIRPESLLAHQITVLLLTAAALPAILLCIRKGR